MKKALLFCGSVLAQLAPSSMFADTIFNFSFGSVVVHGQPGLPYGGSGQFDTVATSTPGIYAMVGVTGTVSGSPFGSETITGLGSNQGTLLYNNEGVSLVDGVNLLFNNGTIELTAGNFPNINLNTGYLAYLSFYANSSLYASEIASVDLKITEAPTGIAATPEPGTLILLGTGLAGMVSQVRRRLFT